MEINILKTNVYRFRYDRTHQMNCRTNIELDIFNEDLKEKSSEPFLTVAEYRL